MKNKTKSGCPHIYLLAKYEDDVVFHKIILNKPYALEARACIREDDKLHVKLFSPASIPQWFRYGHNCKLTSKIMLEKLPSYLESKTENVSIFDKLGKRQFKKNQVYSSKIIQCALLFHYTLL